MAFGTPSITTPVAANLGGTGVSNNAASTLTISGNFGTTFTVSGATSLTLPTTGTLATIAGTETITNKTISKASNTLTGVAGSGVNSDITTITALGNGSISSPNVTAGDADSGWYFPAAKQIAWVVDGGVSGNPEFTFSQGNGFQVGYNGAAGDRITLFNQSGGGTAWSVGIEAAGQYYGFNAGSNAGRFHRVEATGEVYFLGQAFSGAITGFRNGDAGSLFYVRAAATPTASIQEWQSSTGTALASVGPAGTMKPLVTTVAGLPSAATAGQGARAFVTDGSTTVILGLGLTVVGGGANKVPVYSDGTNWIVGG